MKDRKSNISKLKNCYGCGVCAISCPRKIITIKENKNGFYQPQIINQDQCVDCGVCIKVCSFVDDTISVNNLQIISYAGWSKDNNTRKKSSSGGVIFEIAKYLICLGYNACGVRYNSFISRAEHFISESEDDFRQSIGSKYIQSYTFDAFIKFNLKNKYVVIGTPCQIASLKKYIDMMHVQDNFILIDFFCHGVPSMNLWRKYLESISLSHGSMMYEYSWRNKCDGWHNSWIISIKEKKSEKCIYRSSLRNDNDLFFEMFLSNNCLNKACYSDCKFKAIKSHADIRVGDLWGDMYSNNEKGVSAVLAITPKGNNILKSLANRIDLTEIPLDVSLEGQMSVPPKKNYLSKIDPFLLRSRLSLKTISNINKLLIKFVAIMSKIYNSIKCKVH
ncbi:MAG: Coenzyme F420 hydrogenase/dehydrogenase, beta subunit C-terminal domain [Clostridium sp.]|nr:Coenzyme F420 hydrogenase/dehydrogenase, beta subunit C-terminal domain [Clostridium sp.]